MEKSARPQGFFRAFQRQRLGRHTWLGLALGLLLCGDQAQAQSILREVFQGIAGTAISDLTNAAIYPNNPTSTNFVTDFFEAPVDVDDNYGQRMHGYVVPPVSGNYTFWIATDDNGELWLSTDENPSTKRLIASVNGWASSRDWSAEPNQQSAPIPLVAGKAYYVSALQKEGGGGDNLAVRWLRPDNVDEGPIPATYLLPWGTSFTPPIITQQPTNTTAIEGDLATFVIKVKNLDAITYQWRRNGTNIPGGAGGILNYGPVTLADDQTTFDAGLTNKLGGTNSTAATLKVLPDKTKPTLVSALNLGNTQVQVVFSEAVATASGLNPLSYQISGGILVNGAAAGADTRTVILTVTPLIYGQNYTLTVNNVTDRAQTPNTIAANSQFSWLALELVSQGIGVTGGAIQRLGPGAFNVTGGGLDLGGANDQSQFAWEQRTGNFDVQVRVAAATLSSPFLHSGLMARGALETNAAFAGVFGSSAQLGCVFESRTSTGANSATASLTGGFPVNYPLTWLRLRRAGNVFTGFASLDGQSWVPLGTNTLTVPAKVYVGLAVASQSTSTSTAQFRDYGNTTSLVTGSYKPDHEPLGPSSRRTRLVFSEIMYHPKPPAGVTNNLEFVELYNAGEVFEDLTGWTIRGGVNFDFPAGYRLAAGDFVVIAADPAALQTAYGITGVQGPFTGSLNNGADSVRLRDATDAIKLEVNYSSNPPWPVAADGTGHSLVLRNPSYGENNPLAWGASENIGGSPGQLEAIRANPQRSVVINEFLAHTDEPQFDYIELYNHSLAAVDLSGCYLTDDPTTNKFRIPDGTSLSARGFQAWDQNQLGFRLNAAGETIFLINSNATRVLDAIKFEAQENGVASGRSPDGSATIRRLAQPTPGAANAQWRPEAIVLNEIMFSPISGEDADEYVELYNRSTNSVDLAGWKFTAGIDYQFPAPTTLAPGGYLVVAKDSARLLANYPQLNAGNTRGNYAGSLKNSGERLALTMPDDIVSTNVLGDLATNKIHIVVAEVTYGKGGRWNYYADGGGSSLELIDPNADPLRAANWADSDEKQKAAWTSFEFTGPLNLGHANHPPNRFRIGMLGAGECLVDDLEIFRPGSTNLLLNPGFEGGVSGWSLFGNHSTSFLETTGAFAGANCLHVRSQGDGDTGINAIRADITGLASGNTVTMRAKVRWLAGWPEILFRTSGNWIEMPVRMNLPKNLGTPGLPNSRKVANAGPAIYDVTHRPALPRANEAVVVTCRISDPDSFGSLNLRYRVDPASTLTTVVMRDDGTGGDEIAGDGIYSATLAGRSSGSMVAFKIQATDGAGAATTFPKPGVILPLATPAPECLVRWDDPIPDGSFAHYHLWNTQAVDDLRTNPLNNTYREATLVYGNFRVLYNVGFRDKGSPYHGGGGSFAVVNGSDDLLLGTTDRVFRSTGNGGEEPTGIRNPLCSWIGQELGIPHLNTHYMRLYRFNGNGGGPVYNVMLDEEVPTGGYAADQFPSPNEGDLYKIAIWFEFNDDNSGFDSVSSTLESFKSGTAYKLGRYRWNWQTRGYGGTANNYTNLFNLVTAANDNSANFVPNLLNLADIEEWMRIFAFHRVLGNWDSWGFGVGQNMYAYKLPELPWKLMPWDIDFTLGTEVGSNGPTDGLWGGQDPVLNKFFDNFALRRMLWRGFQDAVSGLMLPANYQPQIEARRTALQLNGLGGLAAPTGIGSYMDARRNYLIAQINTADAKQFNITTSGGNDFTSLNPTATITGNAPFAVATIEVNGVPYPVKWTGYTVFSLTVPLTQVTNTLTLVGKDLRGNPVPGATDTITVTYNGAVPQPQDNLGLNEIQYDPTDPNASFIELFNRSSTTPFDLSSFRLEGVGYTFAEGALIQANSYLVLAKDRAAFSLAYGATIPVFDEFTGSLDNGGETLRLVKPGIAPAPDLVISDVRYDQKLPWPTNAAGFGPSLQLVDPAQDPYRVGNWAATATNDVNRVTPGKANAGVRQTLAPFPRVWLNEVLPNNLTGPLDNHGDRDPFIELYNADTNTLDLSAYYLTDNYTNLTQWQFPAGTLIGPKQFLMVWADGEPNESAASIPHTNFRLNPVTGSVALVRLQGSLAAPAVMDYLDYAQLPADRSFGSYPDGEPRKRRLFHFVTPNATNNPASPAIQVTINEIMAGNTHTITDPADGHFDDWFELYNAGTNAVDLTAYSLTDNLTNANQFIIPPGYVIPPGEFLLVWADNDTGQNVATNADLHTNFKLSLTGEQLGLFAPDGTLVDGVTFGPQTNDVSLGRFPENSEPPLVFMESPTPRLPNVLAGGNKPPTLNPIGGKSIAEQTLLNFLATASDPDASQTLSFSLSADAPAGATIDASSGQFTWSPTEAQGPGNYSFVVRVTDSGLPARSAAERITVSVTEVNRAPQLDPISALTVNEGSLLAVTLTATDPDSPTNSLTFNLDPGAPAGATVDPVTGVFTWTPTEAQGPGSYSITARVTDNGTPARSDAKSFTVTVNEVNNPPVLATILPQTVQELSLFTYTVSASDPDSPPSSILYSLDLSPPGAQINATTGVITWTPTEAQGPMNAIFVVRASEVLPPGLSSVQTFSVTVTENNQPPVLAPIVNWMVEEGATLTFTASASDADVPRQTLTYALLPGAPTGASIDPSTGVFTWSTPGDSGAKTNVISVRVADNGPGNLTDTKSFTVITTPKLRVVVNEIMFKPAVAGAEFIELANTSAVTPWDISGWRLTGKNLNFTFAANSTLAPGAFLCVAADVTKFRAAYGAAAPLAGAWTGMLTMDDDLQLLRPGTPALTDRVTFRGTAPWPANANGGGASLQLVDARRDNARVANWSAAASYNGPRQLIVLTNQWRYFQSGPADAGWTSNSFNDAAWPQGAALLYVENAALPAPKNTPLTLGQNTYYFRTRFTIPNVPSGASLVLTNVLDDGAVFYLNGQEIYRQGISAGPVDFNTQGYDYLNPPNAVSDATFTGPFTLPADALIAGENVFAVEVHQVSSGSSDIVFGCSLDLLGGNVPGLTPGAANNVTTTLPDFPPVWINEVLPNNTAGITDSKGEHEPWIELVNAGAQPVPLDGWSLTDSYTNLAKWNFPAGTIIQPGQFLLLFADGEPGDATATELHTSFRLNATTGSLALCRRQLGAPAVVDYLDYAGLAPDTALASLPDGQLHDRIIVTRPTPGASNRGSGPNQSPVLDPLVGQSVNEGELLQFTATATDPDVPPQTLSFTLAPGAPTGASIGATSGVFAWTPGSNQSPSTNQITVRVTDNGTPALSDENTFTVVVIHPGPHLSDAGLTSEGKPTFTWPSVPGQTYRVEFKDDLNDPAWQKAEDIFATGNTTTFIAPAPLTLAQRFYRVLLVP